MGVGHQNGSPGLFGFSPQEMKVYIDNIQVAAVPEPSTFIAGALLALPFGVQGIRYLRNRKRAV